MQLDPHTSHMATAPLVSNKRRRNDDNAEPDCFDPFDNLDAFFFMTEAPSHFMNCDCLDCRHDIQSSSKAPKCAVSTLPPAPQVAALTQPHGQHVDLALFFSQPLLCRLAKLAPPELDHEEENENLLVQVIKYPICPPLSRYSTLPPPDWKLIKRPQKPYNPKLGGLQYLRPQQDSLLQYDLFEQLIQQLYDE